MPRATEPQRRISTIDPASMMAASRGREFAENRLLAAMKESGAKERGQMQAQAELQATQMRGVNQKEIAAMQMAEADRRAAERVKGAELDRRFNRELVQLNDELAQRRAERKRSFDLEDRIYWKGIVDDYTESLREDRNINTALQLHEHKIDIKAMIEMLKTGQKSQKREAKYQVDMLRKREEVRQRREAVNTLKKNIIERYENTPGLIIPEVGPGQKLKYPEPGRSLRILDDEFKKLGVQGFSPEPIIKMGSENLEKMLAGGTLKPDELNKMRLATELMGDIITARAGAAKDRKLKKAVPGRPAIPFEEIFRGEDAMYPREDWTRRYLKKWEEYPDEAGVAYFQDESRDIQQLLSIFDVLQDSKIPMQDGSNQTVGQRVRDTWSQWQGTSQGDILDSYITSTEATDFDSLGQSMMDFSFSELPYWKGMTQREKEEVNRINSRLRMFGDGEEFVGPQEEPTKPAEGDETDAFLEQLRKIPLSVF